jgi:hypothetical protein
MPRFAQPPGMKDALRVSKDRRIADRQTGVPQPAVAGNGVNPDMRKLYTAPLQDATITTIGVNGMRESLITRVLGNQFFTPGDPIVISHTSTSDYGNTTVHTQAGTPDTAHSESELVSSCCGLFPPGDAKFPWVYYHTIGTGDLPTGYYYFLGPTDGPYPGKGPGWPS